MGRDQLVRRGLPGSSLWDFEQVLPMLERALGGATVVALVLVCSDGRAGVVVTSAASLGDLHHERRVAEAIVAGLEEAGFIVPEG